MNTAPNIADPDAFYEMLLDANSDLSDAESSDFATRLMLLLANQVGDTRLLGECIDAAKASVVHSRGSLA